MTAFLFEFDADYCFQFMLSSSLKVKDYFRRFVMHFAICHKQPRDRLISGYLLLISSEKLASSSNFSQPDACLMLSYITVVLTAILITEEFTLRSISAMTRLKELHYYKSSRDSARKSLLINVFTDNLKSHTQINSAIEYSCSN